MFALIQWPVPIILATIVWAIVANIRVLRYVWKNNRKTSMDVILMRASVTGILLFWLAANIIRLAFGLTASTYLAMVSPFTPLVYVIVYGLPADITRRRAQQRDAAIAQAQQEAIDRLNAVASGEVRD